jgi:hypothetical protein
MGSGCNEVSGEVLLALWSEVSKVENWFVCHGKQRSRFIKQLRVSGDVAFGLVNLIWCLRKLCGNSSQGNIPAVCAIMLED